MKLAILAAALASVAPAFAQSQNDTQAYLTTVLGALTGAGLNSLVQVASGIANTTEGAALLASLAQGNHTVFAPNDQAFSGVPAEISSNTTLLTQVLAYHILSTAYLPNGTAIAPNHTIARTSLRGGVYNLPGNQTAPLVLARNSTNATTFNIIQAASNVTAQGPVAAANLQVYVIDQVLTLPPNISAAATQLLPSLAGVAQQAGLIAPLEQASAITVFAPNDAAFGAIQSTLGSLSAEQIQTVLANHVINGTAVYSTGLTSANYTSAGGAPFTFASNSSGAFVTSGNSTARIVQSDIIINNGVVHVIDSVLANVQGNTGAAQSAYESNTAAAATMTQQPTQPVTATSQPASGTASGAGASGSASRTNGADANLTPVNWKNAAIGAVVGTLGLALGGSFIFV